MEGNLYEKINSFNSEEDIIQRLIDEGEIINRYVDITNNKIASENAFPLDFDRYKFLAINHVGPGSKMLEGVFDEEKFDGMLIFRKSPGGWVVSMYAGPKQKLDCGALAKKHGGGGHKDSAGFVCSKLPFKI